MQTLGAVLKSVFATDARTSIHRTALLLLTFVVVHVLGNLAFLAGPEAFNGYGAQLHANPLLVFIEAYLALAAGLHAGVGGYLTWRFKRPLLQRSATPPSLSKVAATLKLGLTGAVVLVFLVVHLSHFRFGPDFRASFAKLYDVSPLDKHAGPLTLPWSGLFF